MDWYVRSQTGWGLRWILLGAFGILFYRARLRAGSWGSIPDSSEFWPLFVAALVLCLAIVVFTSMTVTVKDMEIEVSMGLDLFRKRIPISGISIVEEVRIPWHSVGIKRISGGWLFSVAISGGVDLVMKNGGRFIIGCHDPVGLKAAIVDRMVSSPRKE